MPFGIQFGVSLNNFTMACFDRNKFANDAIENLQLVLSPFPILGKAKQLPLCHCRNQGPVHSTCEAEFPLQLLTRGVIPNEMDDDCGIE